MRKSAVVAGIAVLVFALLEIGLFLFGAMTMGFFELFVALSFVFLGVVVIFFGRTARPRPTRDWLLYGLRFNLGSFFLEVGVVLAFAGFFVIYVFSSSGALADPVFARTWFFIGVLGLCLIVFGSYICVRAWRQRPKRV